MTRRLRRHTFVAGLLGLVACGEARSPVEHSLAWLRGAQSADGLWRSTTYGLLSRGESTTAALVLALAQLPDAPQESARTLADRGLRALAVHRAPSPAVPPEPVDYPCYTAALRLHTLALLQPDGWRTMADELLVFLRQHQIAEPLGWPTDAPEYGGFGLGDRPPRHPQGGELVGMSVTTAVLEAAAAAHVATTDELVTRARTFVERCQQFGGESDDGGFCFAPTHDWRAAKAGFSRDEAGRERARSYGTATADGIRALLASGDRADSPRVVAAIAWLARHAGSQVPGLESADDPTLEPSLRLYWFATLAAVARLLPDHPQATAWRQLVTDGLPGAQRADGNYIGFGVVMKEDDALVATALALSALGALRADR